MNTNSDTLKIFSDAWGQLTHSPIWLVIAIVAFAFGLFLKWLKVFPNRLIPVAVVSFTTFFYAVLSDKAQVTIPESTTVHWIRVSYPFIINSFYGFILGFAVWAGHGWIFKRLEKFLPDGFFGSNGFDTAPPFPNADGSNVRDAKDRITSPQSLAEADKPKDP